MRAADQPGSIKRFQRTPWRFQETFETPLENLELFSSIISGAVAHLDSCTLTIDAVIMPAAKLEALMVSRQLRPELRHDTCIFAETAEEVPSLLVAALGDWVDFLFVPSPKPFVLYADHDEYATFFANTKGNLNRVASALGREGFKPVENYTRPR